MDNRFLGWLGARHVDDETGYVAAQIIAPGNLRSKIPQRYKSRGLMKRFAICLFQGAFLAVACVATSAQPTFPPMTLAVEPKSLTIGGYLSHDRFDEFLSVVEKTSPSKIVFRDVIGGSPRAVNLFSRKISSMDIETQIDGNCFSACALVFMAGTKRTATSRRSALAFHGPRGPNGEELSALANAYKAYLKKRTDQKFPDDLLDLAIGNNSP